MPFQYFGNGTRVPFPHYKIGNSPGSA